MAKYASIDEHIGCLEGWQREAGRELDRLVMETVPTAARVIKWGQPVYDKQGQLCYFKAGKAHINFGFFRDSELADPQGIVEGAGDNMRHVKIKSLDSIPRDALAALILDANKLNQQEKLNLP